MALTRYTLNNAGANVTQYCYTEANRDWFITNANYTYNAANNTAITNSTVYLKGIAATGGSNIFDEEQRAVYQTIVDFENLSAALVINTSNSLSPLAGLTVTSQIARKSGPEVMVTLSFTTGGSAPAAASTLFTLPVGYRPTESVFGILGSMASTTPAHVVVTVATDGTIKNNTALASSTAYTITLSYMLAA